MSSFPSSCMCFRNFRFYVLTISFSLLLAFSFAPNSSAYTLFKSFPNNTDLSTFYTEVYGGCAYSTYNIGTTSDPKNVFLGINGYSDGNITTSASNSYNCGYRYLNSHFNYFQHVAGLKRTLTYSGGEVSTDTYASTGGNTNSIFSYNADWSTYNFDIYNQIELMRLTYAGTASGAYVFDLPVATSSMCTDENDVLQTSGCYEQALYFFGFDMPEFAYLVGTQPYLYSGSLQYTNWPFDSGATYSEVKEKTIFSCGGDWPLGTSDFFSPLFPDFWSNIPTGYNRCFISGFIPLSSDGYIRLGSSAKNIDFVSADASFYSRSGWITTDGLNLAQRMYPWRGLFRSASYKTMGARNDQSFNFINPTFKLYIPDDFSETSTFDTFSNTFSSIRQTIAGGSADIEQGSSDGTPDNSTIMGWFNVFDGLSVLFPFGSFFSAFIAPDTCASIPTLASWLNLPSDTTYCSWWPSSVVTAITPVFTGLSMMLLFGFIVSWLRGDRAYSIFHERSS